MTMTRIFPRRWYHISSILAGLAVFPFFIEMPPVGQLGAGLLFGGLCLVGGLTIADAVYHDD